MNLQPVCVRCDHQEPRGLNDVLELDHPSPGTVRARFSCRGCGAPAFSELRRADIALPAGGHVGEARTGADRRATPLVVVIGAPTRRAARRARRSIAASGRVEVLVVAERVPAMSSHPRIDRSLGSSTYAPALAARVVDRTRPHDVHVVTAGEAEQRIASTDGADVVLVAGPAPADLWVLRRLRRAISVAPVAELAVAEPLSGPVPPVIDLTEGPEDHAEEEQVSAAV
ncbi:MAG TPA: hypothetical protein VK866_19885 [Acidimicrobiales bacterium]|nr:hypothetical protein [Acidimicrobiales bacterium]